MKKVSSAVAIVLSALVAPVALAQTGDAVRLRLALDPDGRLYLSTEPANVLPPSLHQPPLPAPGASGPARTTPGSGIAIDFSARGDDAQVPAGCLTAAGRVAGFGAFGCDLWGYGGLPGAVQGGDVILRFDSEDAYGFDVSYGLDWLRSHDGAMLVGNAFDPAGISDVSMLLPGWVGPMPGQAEWRMERLGIGSYLWLDHGLRLSLDVERLQGPLAFFQIDPSITFSGTPAMPWQGVEQDSITLGLGGGRFQGALTGRQLRPQIPGTGPALDALDLGFSWRMPWKAALEFGARNLIVKPRKADESQQPADGDLRVPYVRYHQEL